MGNQNQLFEVDPTDFDGMVKIMEEYGDSDMPFSGRNDNGEEVIISVSKDNITVRTHQKNGWVRRNSYTFSDGEITSEEIFEGKN